VKIRVKRNAKLQCTIEDGAGKSKILQNADYQTLKKTIKSLV